MFDVVDIKPAIGAELRIDRKSLLDGSRGEDIREVLFRRGVVVIRDCALDDEELREFSGTLGAVRAATGREKLDENENRGGLLRVEYFPGTFFWHMDGTYEDVPPLATVLTPRVLAPSGGQTEFASTYAAYDALPEGERAALASLRVLHTMAASMFDAVPNPALSDYQAWLLFPPQVHPMVWQHRTGRKSLVLGSASAYVEGMHVADSREFLDRLIAHATNDSFVYRHEWRIGDVVIWDNTGTMHRARPYPPDCGRLLHRFAIEGEEPITAVG